MHCKVLAQAAEMAITALLKLGLPPTLRARLLGWRGRRRFHRGQHEVACEDLEIASAGDPQSVELLHMLGTAYLRRSMFEQAATSLARAARLRAKREEAGQPVRPPCYRVQLRLLKEMQESSCFGKLSVQDRLWLVADNSWFWPGQVDSTLEEYLTGAPNPADLAALARLLDKHLPGLDQLQGRLWKCLAVAGQPVPARQIVGVLLHTPCDACSFQLFDQWARHNGGDPWKIFPPQWDGAAIPASFWRGLSQTHWGRSQEEALDLLQQLRQDCPWGQQPQLPWLLWCIWPHLSRRRYAEVARRWLEQRQAWQPLYERVGEEIFGECDGDLQMRLAMALDCPYARCAALYQQGRYAQALKSWPTGGPPPFSFRDLPARLAEQCGDRSALQAFLEEHSCFPEEQHYQQLLRGESVRQLELKATLMAPAQVARVQPKLRRRNLVCHAFHESRPLRRVRPTLVLVHGDHRLDRTHALAVVELAWEFYRRELGAGCPEILPVTVYELQDPHLAGLDWCDNDSVVELVRSRLSGLLPPEARRQIHGDCQIVFFPCNRRYGSGKGFPRQCLVQLTPQLSSSATLLAHEIGHSLLGLPDLQDSRPLEDDLSLMGYSWRGFPADTYLGLRFRAACLTPQKVIALLRRGRPLSAYRKDPFNLAAGLAALAYLDRRRQRRQAKYLGQQLLAQFPSLTVETLIRQALGQSPPLPPAPDLTRQERTHLVWAHFFAGRYGTALRYCDQSTENSLSRQRVKAWKYLKQGKLPPARAIFQARWEQCPNNAMHCYDLAQTLHLQGASQQERARQLVRQGIDCSSPGEQVYGELLDTLYARHWEMALQKVTELERLYPHQQSLPYHRARLLIRTGADPREAFRKAYRLRRGCFEAAHLAWATGHPEVALAAARRALGSASHWGNTLELLALLEPARGWRERLLERLPGWTFDLAPHPNG